MNGVSMGSDAAFADYVHRLVAVIGHADRAEPLNDYCLGLMLPVERKSVEPLAAVTAPARVSAKHQSLLHFVGQAPWSDEALLARVGDLVLPLIERHGPIEAWIVDETGFPKKDKAQSGDCAAMRRRVRSTSRAIVSSWVGVRISRVASWSTRSSRWTSSPSIHSEAQASAKWLRSIQPCPTGERATRSSRRVKAIPARKAGSIRAVILILATS
ncbi:MAG: hypothetical protein EOP21_01580 [Hyphomicrobiales bacterium]|nr:MAG: hypothetical protein EOP21_01580 [Hyphomicrobiales bacterium]